MTHHLIRPCAECERPTRPPHLRLSECPGTMVRRGPVCHSCRMYATPPMSPRKERAHAYNLAGLASFIRRRNERAHTQARATYYQERMSA